MRILVTGVDDQGQSCVVEERTGDDAPFTGGITITVAAETESSPPPPRPPGHGELVPIVRGPGIARWSFVEFPPGITAPLHHTDSIDFDVILDGHVDLILDDGPHTLGSRRRRRDERRRPRLGDARRRLPDECRRDRDPAPRVIP